MPFTSPDERRPKERGLVEDQRGSAYAEGAIVAWFMTMVFGACLWAVQGYAAYSSTGNEARIATWPEAVEGCRNGDPGTIRSQIPTGYKSVMSDVAPLTTAPRLLAVVEDTVTNTISNSATSPALFGGASTNFEETSVTSCNTMPPDDGLAYIRKEALTYYCDLHPEPEWQVGCQYGLLE